MSSSDWHASDSPLDRGLDLVVAGFAAFTLLAHLTVATGGSLDALATQAGLLAIGGGLLAIRALARRERTESTEPVVPTEHVDGLRTGLSLGGTAITAAAYALGASAGLVITLAAVTLLVLLVSDLRGRRTIEPVGAAAPAGWEWAGLLLSMVIGCALALTAHRPDADDAFYLNLAVTAVDHPAAALFAEDGLHGVPGIPLGLPVFKVHALELAIAVVSHVSGASVLFVAHTLLPGIAGALLPITWARLLRLLLPNVWLPALALVLAALALLGDGTRSHADFAFVRLFQGKAILLSVLLPLVAATGLELGFGGRLRTAIRLGLALVASIGASATALWLGPSVAMLALAAACPVDLRGLRRLGFGAAACVYPVLVGLVLRSATVEAFEVATHPLESQGYDGGEFVRRAFVDVLGHGPSSIALAGLPLLVSGLAPSPIVRRFVGLTTAGFLLLFYNPIAARPIAHGLVGPDAYWRVFWLLPVPLFVAVFALVPWSLARGAGLPRMHPRTVVAGGVSAAIAYTLLFALPDRPALSAKNDVAFEAPGPRLPNGVLEQIVRIRTLAGPDSIVLVPFELSRWLPVIHHHPAPLVVRPIYLDLLRERFGADDLARRISLTRFVSGGYRFANPREREAAAEDMRRAIDDYGLSAIVLDPVPAGWAEFQQVLNDSPLERVFRSDEMEIWARGAGSRARHRRQGPVLASVAARAPSDSRAPRRTEILEPLAPKQEPR